MLENLKITNGLDAPVTGRAGGACINSYGNLDLVNATVSDCETHGNGDQALGGALYVIGVLILNRSDVTQNKLTQAANPAGASAGGAIFCGTLVSKYSSIDYNFSTRAGAAIVMGGAQISNSSISKNSGGALMFPVSNAGTVTITNSTISGNYGGTIGAISSVPLITISNSTIDSNHGNAVGGISMYAGINSRIDNSIVSGNTRGPDNEPSDVEVEGGAVSQLSGSHNLMMSPSSTEAPSLVVSSLDAQLKQLALNGGRTRTRCPSISSPALGIGLMPDANTRFDQRGRGYPRSSGGKTDIGACEYDEIFPSDMEPPQ